MGQTECGSADCRDFPPVGTTITVSDYIACGNLNVLPLTFEPMFNPMPSAAAPWPIFVTIYLGPDSNRVRLLTLKLYTVFVSLIAADLHVQGVDWAFSTDPPSGSLIDYNGRAQIFTLPNIYITLGDLKNLNGTPVNLDYKPGDRYEIRGGKLAGCTVPVFGPAVVHFGFKVFFARDPKYEYEANMGTQV